MAQTLAAYPYPRRRAPFRSTEAFFPLRSVLKPLPLLVAYRVLQGHHCRAGVKPNWLAAWLKIPHFPASQQVRSVVGSELNAFARGAITLGSISMIPSLSCNELVRSWTPMAKREHSYKQAPGWSVWMRKPPFKRGRVSSHLAPHAQASLCCTNPAIIVGVPAICLRDSPSLMAKSMGPVVSANVLSISKLLCTSSSFPKRCGGECRQ